VFTWVQQRLVGVGKPRRLQRASSAALAVGLALSLAISDVADVLTTGRLSVSTSARRDVSLTTIVRQRQGKGKVAPRWW